MATDPAPASRRLWQLPTFLAGLGALLALWYFGERIRPSVAERYEKAMVALRPAVDRWPPDPDQVRAALRKVPDAEPPADVYPRVKYLTGSAYVALAEAMPNAESAEMWAKAKQDLEAAADHDLPVSDQKKLRYRLARAWCHVPGTDPIRTIEYLSKYVAAGDDPSEGYRLLAELHRNSTPPDEAAERDDLQNFLKHATQRADARALNSCRIRLAQLHLKLAELEDARKVLDRVGPEAPPELYAEALLMLSRICRTKEDWNSVVKHGEKVRDMKGATDDQRADAKDLLGQAYPILGRNDVADLGNDESPEARAAWFRRADAALRDPTSPKDAAIVNLERTFAGDVPEALRKLIKNIDAKRVIQAAYQKAFADGDFALAVRAATVYGKAIPANDQHRLLVDAHEAWAQAIARDGLRPDDVRDHYRAAAEGCVAGAHADRTSNGGKADWLRRGASLYLKAGDRPKALQVLAESASHLADYPEERLGQAWAEIGDVYLAAGDPEQARVAYQNSSGRPGPAQDRSIIQVASRSYEADPDKGGAIALQTLQELLTRKQTAEPAQVEEALFLLGEIHLMRKEWPDAEAQLKMALESYPQSPRVARGRYHFGQVLRHNAYEAARRIKTDRATIEQIKAERLTARLPALKVDEEIKLLNRLELSQKTYDAMMRGAYDEFRKAEELMLASPDAGDPGVIQRTSFWAADCAYWLGEYVDCATRCEKLMVRYRGRAEELDAGRDLYRCCTFAAQVAHDSKDQQAATTWSQRAADTRVKVSDALAHMPAAEFNGASESRKRGYWETWLTDSQPRK
jgi:hypothetical protein